MLVLHVWSIIHSNWHGLVMPYVKLLVTGLPALLPELDPSTGCARFWWIGLEWAGFLRDLQFVLQILTPLTTPLHRYSRQSSGQSTKWTCAYTHPKNKNNWHDDVHNGLVGVAVPCLVVVPNHDIRFCLLGHAMCRLRCHVCSSIRLFIAFP